MSKQTQAAETQSDKKNRPKIEPSMLEATNELADLTQLPGGPLAATGDGSIEGQAAQLANRRLQTAQRRAMATQIGRVQGNQHLQRVVASLKREEQPTLNQAKGQPSDSAGPSGEASHFEAEPSTPSLSFNEDVLASEATNQTPGNFTAELPHADRSTERGGVPSLIQRTPASNLIQRTPPPGEEAAPVDKSEAEDKLSEWNKKAMLLIDGTRAFIQDNWTRFLGRTFKNPRIGLADSTLGGLVSNSLGNAVTELGGGLIKKGSAAVAGALVGSAIAPGVGTIIGFVVGVLVESAVSAIYDGLQGSAEATQAGRQAASEIQAKNRGINLEAQKALGSLADGVGAIRKNLTKATEQEEVDRIKQWAAQETQKTPAAPKAPPYPIATELLRVWVLEHAGDEEDANKDTDPDQWNEARKEVFGDKDLDERPELFAHQIRLQWSQLGLDTSATNDMQQAAEAKKTEGEGAAGAVRKMFHGKTYTFNHTNNPQAVLQLFASVVAEAREDYSSTKDPIFGTVKVSGEENWDRMFAETNRAGSLKITCTLDLTTADGSCYVNDLKYTLGLPSAVQGQHGTLGKGVILDDSEVSVSPD